MFQSRRSLKLQKKKSKKPTIFLLLIIFILSLPVIGYIFLYKIYFKPVIVSPLSTKVFHASINPTDSLKSELDMAHVPFSSISVSTESAFIVDLPDGSEVLFAKDRNLHEQVASLQLIQSRLTIEGKTIKRLDLRFDKPVIELGK